MSGGSFNYACYAQDLEDFQAKRNDWAALRDAFEAEGYDDIAAEIDGLIIQFGLAERRVSARLERLAPAAKAMEWWKSCDWSRERLDEEVAKLRAGA